MNLSHLSFFTTITLLYLTVGAGFTSYAQPTQVLVFSKTEGFRHQSIPEGKQALIQLGKGHSFSVDTTENAEYFTEDSLRKYKVVVFLSTTQDVLNDVQQAEFERFIQAGGGFVGIHAAADTEYDWPWYNKLVGAQFKSHPKQQEAVIQVMDKDFVATQHLPDQWKVFDELYNYKNINPDIHVVAKLDESTYEGGENNGDHPFIWYHEFDGGRAFYTGRGHTDEAFHEPLFLQHLLSGITWAMGQPDHSLDYSKATTERIMEERDGQ